MVKPVVFGGYVNGYGIIRAFGEKGITSLLVERKRVKSAATASKYVEKTYYFADPELDKEEFLNEMVFLGKEIAPNKGMLFPTHDEYVITLWENQEVLKEYFEFPMSEWEKVEQLINKKNLYALCDEMGIDCPKTKEIQTYEEYLEVIGEFMFPIIIKPSVWDTELIAELGQKVFIIDKKDEAHSFVEKIYKNTVCSRKLLIQEYIKGSILKMPDITVFSDKQGKIKSWTVGVKTRQFPPQTGTSTMATILSPNLEMCKKTYMMTKKLVEAIGFYGVCDAEYMYDARDGKYKMIEVNTRFHMQNYMICASGVNMAYYIFCEHQGLPYEYNEMPIKKVSWCKPIEDKYNATKYNKKKYPGFGISKKEWRASVPKNSIGIMDNKQDMKVYFRYAGSIYKRILADKIRSIFGIPENQSIKKIIFRR